MSAPTMRFSLAAVLGLGMGIVTPLIALQVPASASTTTVAIGPGIPASDGELSAAVQTHIARGASLTGIQRYAEAEREYRAAADIVRRQGHLPSLTLWHLACAYYYEGNPHQGAVVLERLAGEASQWGDLVVQALALYHAAWLNGQAGSSRAAATEVADLTRLLQSRYMPVAVRDHLNGRLNPPEAIAVQH